MTETFDRIVADVQEIVEKTGSEAEVLADKLKSKLSSMEQDVRSMDLSVELEDISEDLDELAQKTGSEAKQLAKAIDQKLDVLAEKINLGKNFDIISRGIDDLIDATGDEAAELVGHVMDYLRKAEDDVSSVDVKEDVRELSGKLKVLAGKTGKEAESVAKDIKESIRKLQYKMFG